MKKQLILLSLFTAFCVALPTLSKAQTCTDIVVTAPPTAHTTYFQVDGYGQNADTVSYYGMQEKVLPNGSWHNIITPTPLHDLCTGFGFTFLKNKVDMANNKKYAYRMFLITASGNTLYGVIRIIQKKGCINNNLALPPENRSDIITDARLSQAQILKDAGIESSAFTSKIVFSSDLPKEESDATERVAGEESTSTISIEIAASEVNIYNPTKEPLTVILSTVEGKILYQENYSQVGSKVHYNFSEQAPGIYIVTAIDSKSVVHTKKMVIAH